MIFLSYLANKGPNFVESKKTVSGIFLCFIFLYIFLQSFYIPDGNRILSSINKMEQPLGVLLGFLPLRAIS